MPTPKKAASSPKNALSKPVQPDAALAAVVGNNGGKSAPRDGRQTLYGHVAPDGTLRKDGLQVIEGGKIRYGKQK
jgi:hypothetical protein